MIRDYVQEKDNGFVDFGGRQSKTTSGIASLKHFVRSREERRADMIREYCCQVCGGLQAAKMEEVISPVLQHYIGKENFGNCTCRPPQPKLAELPLAVLVGVGSSSRLYLHGGGGNFICVQTGKYLVRIPNKDWFKSDVAVNLLNILLEYWGGHRFYYFTDKQELAAIRANYPPKQQPKTLKIKPLNLFEL